MQITSPRTRDQRRRAPGACTGRRGWHQRQESRRCNHARNKPGDRRRRSPRCSGIGDRLQFPGQRARHLGRETGLAGHWLAGGQPRCFVFPSACRVACAGSELIRGIGNDSAAGDRCTLCSVQTVLSTACVTVCTWILTSLLTANPVSAERRGGRRGTPRHAA